MQTLFNRYIINSTSYFLLTPIALALKLEHRIEMASTTGPKPPPRFARQEVAPAAGYPEINVARNVPKSVGKNAGLLMLGGAAVMAVGFYRIGTFNVKRRYAQCIV